MKSMAEESRGEYSDLLLELETLIEGWGDACIQHKNMFTLLKKEKGKTDCISKGCEMSLKVCIADIKELIKKYS